MVGLDNPLHIAMVLVVVLLVFGAKRLPEMGKGLGEGLRGFRSGLSGEAHAEPDHGLRRLAAADESPAVTSSDTERRATEPVA